MTWYNIKMGKRNDIYSYNILTIWKSINNNIYEKTVKDILVQYYAISCTKDFTTLSIYIVLINLRCWSIDLGRDGKIWHAYEGDVSNVINYKIR